MTELIGNSKKNRGKQIIISRFAFIQVRILKQITKNNKPDIIKKKEPKPRINIEHLLLDCNSKPGNP